MDSKVRIILLAHSAPQVKPSIKRPAGLPSLNTCLPLRRARACECYGSYYPPVVELCVAAEPSGPSPPSCAATYLPGRRPRTNRVGFLPPSSHPFGIVARNEKGAVHTDGDKTVTKEKPQEKSGRQKSSRQTPPSKCRRELIFLESKPCLNSCSNSSRTRSIFLATLAKEAGFGRVCIV